MCPIVTIKIDISQDFLSSQIHIIRELNAEIAGSISFKSYQDTKISIEN